MHIRNLIRGLICLSVIVICLETYQILTDSTAFTSAFAAIVFDKNFHEVVPNRFYRSAEMPLDDLAEVIREQKIKTIIDLRRGIDEGDEQGRTEKITAESMGTSYVHVPMNGSEIPSKEIVSDLLKAFDKSETPILVHCTSGTHRSGFASAVWLLDKENESFDVASKQMTIHYGFFRLERSLKAYFQGYPTIDEVLWTYNEQAEASSFRKWVAASLK